MSKFLLLL